jgi:hypothetical protein
MDCVLPQSTHALEIRRTLHKNCQHVLAQTTYPKPLQVLSNKVHKAEREKKERKKERNPKTMDGGKGKILNLSHLAPLKSLVGRERFCN